MRDPRVWNVELTHDRGFPAYRANVSYTIGHLWWKKRKTHSVFTPALALKSTASLHEVSWYFQVLLENGSYETRVIGDPIMLEKLGIAYMWYMYND